LIYRVGLTGGLASGKSTVAERLRQDGIPVLDADRIVHGLYAPGGPGARAVAEAFGPEFLDESGAVDRARLAAHVFANPEALARLNALIHPLVFEEQAGWFREQERAGHALGAVEATLLVETGGRARYDCLIVLSAPEEMRLARAAARNPEVPVDELRRRVRAQLPDAEREKQADIVLRTDGTKEDLFARVDALAERLRSAAGDYRSPRR
jgi:dephospho-CoA kinase